jgi:hypothetical protein
VISDKDWREGVGYCCVYGLFRPDGTPCYVGEGGTNRPEQHLVLARSSSQHLYYQIREVQKTQGPIRTRILYQGVAKWKALKLEWALIKEFLNEFGREALFNRKGIYYEHPGHSPHAVAQVRADKHLWRLASLTAKTGESRVSPDKA